MPNRSGPGAGPPRRSKLTSLDEALAPIVSGGLLAIGGLWFHNRPTAAVRALIRKGVRDLTLITAPPSSYDTDLLIGAGLVRKAYLAHVSFEHLGLAPNVRAGAERGTFELVECDESTLLGGLMATAEGLAEHPITSLRGTDHLRTSPLAVPYPVEGHEPGLIAAPALRPDVAILHAQEADMHGNARWLGVPFGDPLIAKAARHVVVTVDRVISNGQVRAEPHRTTLPGYLVDAVVEVPFGAHPCSSHTLYPHDEEHLREYLGAARATVDGSDAQAFSRYLNRYIFEPSSHDDYLAMVGGSERLAGLKEVVA